MVKELTWRKAIATQSSSWQWRLQVGGSRFLKWYFLKHDRKTIAVNPFGSFFGPANLTFDKGYSRSSWNYWDFWNDQTMKLGWESKLRKTAKFAYFSACAA